MSFLADSRQFEGFRSPFATGFPGFWAAFGDGVLLRYYPLAESRLKPPPKLNMLQKYNTKKTLDMGSRFWYTVSMVMRKKRSDRNHVLYMVTCEDTGDTYVGLTVALGQAYLKSVKIRWQKHMSRARCEGRIGIFVMLCECLMNAIGVIRFSKWSAVVRMHTSVSVN
jgi:hypothetical protein